MGDQPGRWPDAGTTATKPMQNGVEAWETAGRLGMSVRVLETVYGKYRPDYQSELLKYPEPKLIRADRKKT